jgi:hypothetical protein
MVCRSALPAIFNCLLRLCFLLLLLLLLLLPLTCSVMRLMTRVTGRPLSTAGW